MPIFDVLRPIWSKNRFSLFCNNVIATFCYSNLKAEAAAENDDDKAAKDCLCDDDGGNVDCHKIPLVSRFIVSFAFCLWVSLIQLIFSRFEHHLLLFLLFRLEVQQTMPYHTKKRKIFFLCLYVWRKHLFLCLYWRSAYNRRLLYFGAFFAPFDHHRPKRAKHRAEHAVDTTMV